MAFVNIDAPGNAVHRRGVRAIMKAHGSSDRQAAAKARRYARAAKRAGGPNVIILNSYPQDTVTRRHPDGAYIWDGRQPDSGYLQIIVVGPLKAEVDDYRKAAQLWHGRPLRLFSATKMMAEDPEYNAEVADRGFLDIMLVLDDGTDRPAPVYPAGWPNS